MPIIHKHFEMGTAPYTFVGMWSMPSISLAENNPEAYNNALREKPKMCHGTCDHCGMGILHHYILRDADRNYFSVGSECVNKLDDVENMDAVEYQKRKHQKSLRMARAEVKREQKRLDHQAKLDQQREANGGLTDYELGEKRREDELMQKRRDNEEKFAYFIDYLGLGNDFAGELAKGMRDNGQLPYGRGRSIMLEMIAKTEGRKNSKAYNAKYEEAETKLEELS